MSPYGAMGLLCLLNRLGGEKGSKLLTQRAQVLETFPDMTLKLIMAEVETMEDELQEKHSESGKYTDHQLRSWAHLIQMKKHGSYDEPPDKPFSAHQRNLQVSQPQRQQFLLGSGLICVVSV